MLTERERSKQPGAYGPFGGSATVSEEVRPLEMLLDRMGRNLAHSTGASVVELSLWPHLPSGVIVRPAETRHASGWGAVADDFALVLERVAALPKIDGDEGPTEDALAATLRLLSAAHTLFEGSFPRASASTTVDGGIHVYWERPGRTLQLSIPACADGAGFIYHRDRDGYDAERDTSPRSLARWIRWFMHA